MYKTQNIPQVLIYIKYIKTDSGFVRSSEYVASSDNSEKIVNCCPVQGFWRTPYWGEVGRKKYQEPR